MTRFNPDRLWHALEEAAEARANAEQEAHILERNGEILLAELMLEAKRQGHPIGLCKEVARTDPKWKVHCDGEAVAVRNRSRERARYENLKIRFEAMRTLEATERVLAK